LNKFECDDLRYLLDLLGQIYFLCKAVYGSDLTGETFRVLKEKEERQHSEYRTRRLVEEAWDKLITLL